MTEIPTIIVTIASSAFVLLIGILVYFIKKFFKQVDKMNDTLQKISVSFAIQKNNCRHLHDTIDKDLTDINVSIDDHSKRIVKIEKKLDL